MNKAKEAPSNEVKPALSVKNQEFVDDALSKCKRHVAVFLRNRRKELGLTQAQVAEMAGCSPGTIFLLERGDQLLSLKTLFILSHVLHSGINEFFPVTTRPTFANDVIHQTATAREAFERHVLAVRAALDNLDEMANSQRDGG